MDGSLGKERTSPAPTSRAPLDELVDRFRREPSRLWSLLVTLYGDAILPRGGSVAMSTLTKIVSALGVTDGALRTAMSRLANDGWLLRHRVGRNSFYRVAAKGRDTFAEASEHIYHPPQTAWTGQFELAILTPDADRQAVQALQAAGFGSLPGGTWLAPGGAQGPTGAGIHRLRASTDRESSLHLAASAWPLERTGAAYASFLSVFQPIGARLDAGLTLSELDSLLLRLLLIHDYRRAVLRDPLLPAELLPPDWPGHEARRVCGRIYLAVLDASERWLDANGASERGPLPPADPAVFRRFR